MPDLQYTSFQKDSVLIIRISGRLDIDTAPIFNNNIEQEIEKGIKKYIVNMNDIAHLASAGLGALINIAGILKKNNGVMKICTADNDMINKIFQLHGIAHIFETFDSEDKAFESFNTSEY